MRPTFAIGRNGRRYRYYVSAPLQRGRPRRADDEAIRREPGARIEAFIADSIRRLVPSVASDPLAALSRVEVHPRSLELLLSAKHWATIRSRLSADEQIERDADNASLARLSLPIRPSLRGGRKSLLAAGPAQVRHDPVMIRGLRTAHSMLERDASGLPTLDVTPATPYLRRLVRLALLAPELQRQILEGRQPAGLYLEDLSRGAIPLSWREQRRMFSHSPE